MSEETITLKRPRNCETGERSFPDPVTDVNAPFSADCAASFKDRMEMVEDDDGDAMQMLEYAITNWTGSRNRQGAEG
jgi:hypothetical protein